MTTILRDRERALEFEFFRKVDQKLLKDMKKKLDFERRCGELCKSTGIRDAILLRELAELGIDDKTLLALTLFPLVQVAWADGKVDTAERNAVLKAAADACGGEESPSYKLLESWLEEPPSPELINAWRDYVIELIDQVSLDAAQSLRIELLSQAKRVAEAAGGILGIHRVCDSEHKVLKELEFFLSEPYPSM